MDTIQMRWFFRVSGSITYGSDEFCGHGTYASCDDDLRQPQQLHSDSTTGHLQVL